MAPVTTVAQLCAHIDAVADRLSAQIRGMEGRLSDELGEMDSGLGGRIRELESGLCGRLDSVIRQLRWIQVCLLVVLAMMIAILLRI